MTSGRPAEPLPGRATELSRLHALLDDALAGRPRVVLCSGEPGIGKTALMRRFSGEAARRGASVLWPPSFGSPGPPPYWLWRHALGPPDPAGTHPVTLVERLAGRLRRAGTGHGVVLAVDDLDQADGPSMHTLLGVVRFLRSDRVLICATCADDGRARPDWHGVRARLLGEPVTEALALGGLTRDEAWSHLEALVGRHVPELATAGALCREVGAPGGGSWRWPARRTAIHSRLASARSRAWSPRGSATEASPSGW